MPGEITLNLCSDIREAVTPILEQIRALVWLVSVIEWKSKSALTVKFTAHHSPSGREALVVCEERYLPERLQALSEER
jgi:hypothetical protein